MARTGLREKLNRRRILTLAGAVVALAVIIAVGSALSSPRSASGPGLDGERQAVEQAEKIALDAQTALSADETQTALALAEEALRLDPQNGAARRVVSAVRDRRTSSGGRVPSGSAQRPGDSQGGSSGGNTKKPGDGPSEGDPGDQPPLTEPGKYADKVADADALVPATFRDWDAGRRLSVDTDTQVTFEPDLRSADARVAVRSYVYARDMRSAAEAERFIATVSREAYSQEGRDVRVGAGYAGYSGARDRQVSVSFARGRYAFEAVVIAQPGASIADAARIALELAGVIPAASN